MSTSTVRHARPQIRSAFEHLTPLSLSALLLALAFPQPGWGLLAYIALTPAAIVAIYSIDAKRLAWTGYLVALAWWLVRISWMPAVTVGGYFALAGYLALYLPAALLLIKHFNRHYRLPLTLTLPMVWVSLELVRTYFPAGGFAWFSLAHSQTPFRPGQGASHIIQIADIFGEHGVSFIIAMTNGLLADLVSLPWFVRRRHHQRRTSRRLKAAVTLWLVTITGAHVYGYYRIGETDADSDQPHINVAVIQTNVPQDNKINPTLEQIEADWATMIALTRQAKAKHPTVNLIVWPETMVPTALNPESIEHYQKSSSGRIRFHHDVQNLARSIRTHLLVGAHAYYDWTKIPTPDGQAYYHIPAKRFNSVYHYRPDGNQNPDHYNKIHRVPFGEYIPWVESIPPLKRLFIKYLSPHEVDYTLQKGQAWTIFDIATTDQHTPDNPASQQTHPVGLAKQARIATPICFEDAVARVTRRMAYSPENEKRADMLVNLTNDGWYAGTHEGPQHFQIAVLRCIETRVPMVRCVNTGVSGFIDSAGRAGPFVTVNGEHQEVVGFATTTVKFDPRRTWFSLLGHIPAIALAIVTATLAIVAPWLTR